MLLQRPNNHQEKKSQRPSVRKLSKSKLDSDKKIVTDDKIPKKGMIRVYKKMF